MPTLEQKYAELISAAKSSGVSNLAGYCTSRSGARVAFAFLMSGVSIYTAHPLQDRMAGVLARYRP